MISILRNILLIGLFFAIFPNNAAPRHSENSPLVDIPTLSTIAKKEFLNDYYGYLQTDKDFLTDTEYTNNLVILCDIDRNFPQNGEILLGLINQLEKTNDGSSAYLLKKLSKYFDLEFHQYICTMDLPRDKQAPLFHAYHVLNEHSINHNGQEIFPFRTVLTQTIISFFIIHNAKAHFNQKKNSWILTAEKIRSKLHALNDALNNEKVNSKAIDNFIDTIEVYALTEPLIPPRKAMRIIVTALIIVAAAGTTAYLVHRLRPQWYEDLKWVLGELSKSMSEGFMVPVRAVAKETIEELNRNMEPMANNFTKGMAYNRVVPNPHADPTNPAYDPAAPAVVPAIKNPQWLETMRKPDYHDPHHPRVDEWIPAPVENNLQQSAMMSLLASQFTEGLVTITGIRNPAYDDPGYDRTTPQYLPHPQAGQPGQPHVVINPAYRPEYIPAPNNNPARLPNPNLTTAAGLFTQGLAYETLVRNPLFGPDNPGQPEYIQQPESDIRIPNQSMQRVATDFGTNVTTGLITMQGTRNPAYDPNIPEFLPNPQAGQPGQHPLLRNPAYQPQYIPAAPADPSRIENPALSTAAEIFTKGLATEQLMENPLHDPLAPNPLQPPLVPKPADGNRTPNQSMQQVATDFGTNITTGLTTIQGTPNPAYDPTIPEFIQNPQAGQPGQLPVLRNPAFHPRYIPATPADPTRIDNPALPKAGELLANGLATQDLIDNPFHNAAAPDPNQPPQVPVPRAPGKGPNQDIMDLGELLGVGVGNGIQHSAAGTASSTWRAGGYNPLAWSLGGWNPFASNNG